MSKGESIQEFYENKYDFMPDNLRKEIGHFNVFKLEPYVGKGAKPAPYKRRDYFKITLVKGNGKFHYADKVVEVQKSAIVFSNPQIPYSWEQRDRIIGGYFCIFDQAFFHHYGNLNQYSLFQPDGNHVFEITDEQLKTLSATYERMFEEINSDYIHKYDVLRTIVFEIVHFALKMAPSDNLTKHPLNAAQRISTLFLELLERQFPIDDPHQIISLRSASDYAEKLNVHVNHLNRAIKETTDKTTSQIIGERIVQEAKILLRETAWSVSEIAYALGFTEVTHFNNFFKKHIQLSPMKFRNI
ncbi:AraC family transcriptional regulator [Flavobacterium sp. AED]|uniref:helix-turn-helix domain-containing protein n=1 Tax=Flavobacterium sp. AED TaxID=1423323 RepID=UPI00057E7411|nr:helix-turn-helix domain-containing protein [Flavobacterium sp. AED]KIA85715.1 transcriptional regulator [Flavobacterium sp. AED]MDI1305124.1 helix-turn-helix domain-containing protein [bacterium]